MRIDSLRWFGRSDEGKGLEILGSVVLKVKRVVKMTKITQTFLWSIVLSLGLSLVTGCPTEPVDPDAVPLCDRDGDGAVIIPVVVTIVTTTIRI